MSWVEIVALILAGAAAGMINAVAGGGTLLTFPALLYFGTSPMVANATSTTALVIGTAGSIFGFQKQFPAIRHWLGRFVPVSIVGGWLGSFLLTRSGDQLFAALVPYLILFATVLFLLQEAIRRWMGPPAANAAPRHITAPWLAVVFQFGVALYGGYFGAGIGILMLASLGLIGLTDIHQMNALKNLLGSLINGVAATWFVASGMVDWNRAGMMTIGALTGYYLGASLSQRIPRPMVRHVVTAIGFTISAIMFYRQFS
ncbi:MAG: sulfite exporter TauE/SafE family protein [Verrucomicrobiota bacterium]